MGGGAEYGGLFEASTALISADLISLSATTGSQYLVVFRFAKSNIFFFFRDRSEFERDDGLVVKLVHCREEGCGGF